MRFNLFKVVLNLFDFILILVFYHLPFVVAEVYLIHFIAFSMIYY